MPIKVTCQCGKSFAAKDELAGKAVKCPNCQQPLRIPGAPAAAPAAPGRNLAAPLPSAAPRQQATSAAAFGPPPNAGGGAHSLFDEAGLKQAPVGATMCPGCAAPMPSGAVVCIKCGYNAKLGRRMETVKMGAEAGGPGAHGASTQDLLYKAAVSIEEDKEEEKKKTRQGMPWWAYGIGLLFVIAFIVMMMVLPQRVALRTGGALIYLIAFAIHVYAVIMIWTIAFEEGAGTGIAVVLGTLLCGCGAAVYCFMRWDRCGSYFLMLLATNVVTGLIEGAIEANMMWAEEEARAAQSPPAAIAQAGFDYQPPPLLKSTAA